MKRKGFTLVELLAVIVILAVVAIISIPLIGNVIEESRKKALEESAYGIVEAANYYMLRNEMTEAVTFEFKDGKQISENKLDYKGSIEGSGYLYVNNNEEISLCINTDKYYVHKNYNGEIITGNIADNGLCAIKHIGEHYISYVESDGEPIDPNERPSITNLQVDNKTVSFTLNDRNGLYGYAITTTIDTPEEWIEIDGNSIDLSDTPSEPGEHYIHVINVNSISQYEPFEIEEKNFYALDVEDIVDDATVLYGGLDWQVISKDEQNVTLILDSNYKTDKFDTNGSASFVNSTSYNILNQQFLQEYPFFQKAIDNDLIEVAGTNNDNPYYVRLPEKNELSSSIANTSSTPFWTMTASGNNLYFGDPTGVVGIQYYTYSTTLYQDQDATGGLSRIIRTPNIGVTTGATISPNLETAAYSYRTSSAYYADDYYQSCSGTSKTFCSGFGQTTGTAFGAVACYYLANPYTCSQRTLYSLVSGSIGLRPVITVKL